MQGALAPARPAAIMAGLISASQSDSVWAEFRDNFLQIETFTAPLAVEPASQASARRKKTTELIVMEPLAAR